MFSNRFNRWTAAAIALAGSAIVAVPGGVSAQTPDRPADTAAQFPTRNDLKSLTGAGSYLAARHASVERDASSAAAFYRSALRTDPKNNELLDRAFISSLADGDIDEAVKLADRILTMDKANRVARLVVGVRDLKQKKYAAAQVNINQSIRGPITDLVATLLSGWASYGAGDSKAAVANIDKLTGPEWYPIFKDLHSGMILELAGKEKEAGARLERAYKLDDSMLRVADDYARWLSRNKDAAAASCPPRSHAGLPAPADYAAPWPRTPGRPPSPTPRPCCARSSARIHLRGATRHRRACRRARAAHRLPSACRQVQASCRCAGP